MNMDEKRSRSKRKNMNAEEGYWDCSVCTFRNSPEAFKCEICEFRKGTSTRSGRKPRINPAVVMQQVGQQVFTPPLKKEKKEGMKKDGAQKKGEGEPSSVLPKEPSTSKDIAKETTKENSPKSAGNKKQRAPRLKNIDRSSGRSMEVTVGSVTVVITDYQPKKPSEKPPASSSSAASLSPSSTASTTSTTPSNKPQTSDGAAKSQTVVNGNAITRDES